MLFLARIEESTDRIFSDGRRLLGSTCLWQGDFIEAHANLVEALSIYDPERDCEARFHWPGYRRGRESPTRHHQVAAR
jgi:hypothetical protein